MSDNVNHPAHYTDGKIEVIDFIEDKNLNYHRGNAVKYIARAGKKDGFDCGKISMCVNKKRKSHGGYEWRSANDSRQRT